MGNTTTRDPVPASQGPTRARPVIEGGVTVRTLAELQRYAAGDITEINWSGQSVERREFKTLLQLLPSATNLKRLSLTGFELFDEGVRQLAPLLPDIAKLEFLNLGDNGISVKGLTMLAEVLPKCPALKSFMFARNKLADENMPLLASLVQQCQGLVEVNFHFCGLTAAADVDFLVRAVAYHPTLRRVWLNRYENEFPALHERGILLSPVFGGRTKRALRECEQPTVETASSEPQAGDIVLDISGWTEQIPNQEDEATDIESRGPASETPSECSLQSDDKPAPKAFEVASPFVLDLSDLDLNYQAD
eukprot:m.256466 g.256466  ORF g.256466 m.256466 type:complete len:306 (-) comp54555_c0_seq3:77-994(-)